MRNFALGLMLRGALSAGAIGGQQPSIAAPQPEVAKLPGRVIDVKAGEFFFQAPDTIRAGLVTFRLHQSGMLAERHAAGLSGRALVADQGDNTRGFHMLWVVRLDSGKTAADLYRAARDKSETPWATHLGGPGLTLPPRTANATLVLEPGNYALVCFVGSAREVRTRYHFLNGMFRPLTVVPTSDPVAIAKHDVVARIVGDGVVEFSVPIRAGRHVIRVENTTSRRKEFKFTRMVTGLTGPQADNVGWGGLSDVPPGGWVITTMDFEPGEYLVGTWPEPHPSRRVITVTPGPR